MPNVIAVCTIVTTVVAAFASGTSMRSAAAVMPTGSWPTSNGTVYYKEPYTVKKGQTFDGGMKTYARSNVKCTGQQETNRETSVFMVEPGATLKNVIIGKDQMEGVHCAQNDCKIENVWWDDVCEDALTIKGGSANSMTQVIGGGARSAHDKIIQHNGLGTVSIEGFYAQDFGKLYRSCGTCSNTSRKVTLTNVLAVNGKVSVATVNKNWNDQAKLQNIIIRGKRIAVCQWSEGSILGNPKTVGAGPSGSLCQYSNSTITYA
ncbi:putative pectate lyase PlyH/PlyE, pectin lyase/virulence factor [Plasmopara halstedii]